MPGTNQSVSQDGEQPDASEGKAIADCDLDVDYENCDIEYAKMVIDILPDIDALHYLAEDLASTSGMRT